MDSSNIRDLLLPKSAIFSLVDVSLLDVLRSGTADLYEEFRSSVMSDPSLVTRDYYIAHLNAFHSSIGLLMKKISWPLLKQEGMCHPEERLARCRRIRADLEALGEAGPINRLDQQEDKSPDLCLASSIGAMYVIEGGVHFGREIAAAYLAADIGIKPDQITFLRGYGSKTHIMWRNFLVWLDRYECDDSIKSGARDAAVEAFQMLAYSISPKPTGQASGSASVI